MHRVIAHPGEDQRVLPFEESLRAYTAGGTSLGRVHFERGHLGCAVFGSRQRVGIAGHGKHHGAGRRSQSVIAFLIGPGDLVGCDYIECGNLAAFRKLDARHASGRAALRAYILRLEGQ